MTDTAKVRTLHLACLAALLAAPFMLAPYHATHLAGIMVLAVFAFGYDLTSSYTGLLSLGHALFFAAEMYGPGCQFFCRRGGRLCQRWPRDFWPGGRL